MCCLTCEERRIPIQTPTGLGGLPHPSAEKVANRPFLPVRPFVRTGPRPAKFVGNHLHHHSPSAMAEEEGTPALGSRQRMLEVLRQLQETSDVVTQNSIIEAEFGNVSLMVDELIKLHQSVKSQRRHPPAAIAAADQFSHTDGRNKRKTATAADDDSKPPSGKRSDDGAGKAGNSLASRMWGAISGAISGAIFGGKKGEEVNPIQDITLITDELAKRKRNIDYRDTKSVKPTGELDPALLFVNFLFSFMPSAVDASYAKSYVDMMPQEVDPRSEKETGGAPHISTHEYEERVVNYDRRNYPIRMHSSATPGCILPFVSAGVRFNNEFHPARSTSDPNPTRASLEVMGEKLLRNDCILQTVALVESSDIMWWHPLQQVPGHVMHSLTCTTPWQLYRLMPVFGIDILNNRVVYGRPFAGLSERTGSLASNAMFDHAINALLLENANLAIDMPKGTAEYARAAARLAETCDQWAMCNFGGPRPGKLFAPVRGDRATDLVNDFTDLLCTYGGEDLAPASAAAASPMDVTTPKPAAARRFLFDADTRSIQMCQYARPGQLETTIVTDLARALAMSKWCAKPYAQSMATKSVKTMYGDHVALVHKQLDRLLTAQADYANEVDETLRLDPVLLRLYQDSWKGKYVSLPENDKWARRIPYVFMYFPQKTLGLEYKDSLSADREEDGRPETFTFNVRLPEGMEHPAELNTHAKQLEGIIASLRRVEEWLFDPTVENSIFGTLLSTAPEGNRIKALMAMFKNKLLRWVIALDNESENLLRSGVMRTNSTIPISSAAGRQPVLVLKTPRNASEKAHDEATLMKELDQARDKRTSLTIYGIGVLVNMSMLTLREWQLANPTPGEQENLGKEYSTYMSMLRTVFTQDTFVSDKLVKLPLADSPPPESFRVSSAPANRVRVPELAADQSREENDTSMNSASSEDEGGEPAYTEGDEDEGDYVSREYDGDDDGKDKYYSAADDGDDDSQENRKDIADRVLGTDYASPETPPATTTTTTTTATTAVTPLPDDMDIDANSDNPAPETTDSSQVAASAEEQFAESLRAAMAFTNGQAHSRSLNASAMYYQEAARRVEELQAKEKKLAREAIQTLEAQQVKLLADIESGPTQL